MKNRPLIKNASRCAFIVAITFGSGFSQEIEHSNFFTRSGKHNGAFLHAEIGLIESIAVTSDGRDTPPKTYHTDHGINLGLGYSLGAGMIAHLSADMNAVDRGESIPIFILSVGPRCTWYTPIANTFITGSVYYSYLDAQGGNASFCNRWRLGLGKEVLLHKHFGVGLMGPYEGGRWTNGETNAPNWKMHGARLNLSLTFN